MKITDTHPRESGPAATDLLSDLSERCGWRPASPPQWLRVAEFFDSTGDHWLFPLAHLARYETLESPPGQWALTLVFASHRVIVKDSLGGINEALGGILEGAAFLCAKGNEPSNSFLLQRRDVEHMEVRVNTEYAYA